MTETDIQVEEQKIEIVPPEPIVEYGDSLLNSKSTFCVDFGPDLQYLFRRLASTMKVYRGVGISAIQIAVPFQACIVAPPGKDPILAVNGRITAREGEQVFQREGCLSMPGTPKTPFAIPIYRSEEVTVEYQDPKGDSHKIVATGFEARIWQHELDHSNGKLIIDRCASSFRRREALNKYRKLQGKRK